MKKREAEEGEKEATTKREEQKVQEAQEMKNMQQIRHIEPNSRISAVMQRPNSV